MSLSQVSTCIQQVGAVRGSSKEKRGPRNESQEPEGPRRLGQEEGHLSWQDGGPATGVGGDGRRPEEAVAG